MPHTPLHSDIARQLAVLSDSIRSVQDQDATLREQRRTLIFALVEQGVRRADIAQACGLSRQRLSKVLDRNAPPRKRRAA